MKRRQIVKWLVLIIAALGAIGVRADVLTPSPHVLSYKEWITEIRPSVLLRFIIPCSALVIFLSVLVFSMRQRRPSYLLWLAWCAPLPFFVPITYEWEEGEILFFSILSVLIVSWLVSVIFYFRTRKFVQALGCLIVAPFAFVLFWYWVEHFCPESFKANFNDMSSYYGGVVAAREGESYEEYLKRANRIAHHHCNRCDKPMKKYWPDYWLCPDCDKGKMTCQKCGAQKEQEGLGLHWQDGFKWLCPNCDKDRREEIKRQVEEKRNRK